LQDCRENVTTNYWSCIAAGGKKENLLLEYGESFECVGEFYYLGICLVVEVVQGKPHE